MSAHEMKDMKNGSGLTLEQVRQELKGVKGKRYWQSVDELANTAEFQAAVEKEFPSAAQEWIDPVSRRGFMKLMGASMALAGLAGCTKQPDEPIYPYVKAPEDLILGKPMYFATAHPFVTGAVPLLVKSDQFRPIKIDGNPEHPYNIGSSDPLTQGTLLDLYDPDRSQHVMYRGEIREWAEFAQALREKLTESKDGSGVYLLSATVTSPTLARQWKAAQAAWPKAKFVQYDPAIAGTALQNGAAKQYNLADADVIVSLDADFLSGASYPGFHKLVGDYARRRKDPNKLNRLYSIESTPTTTGLKAEHRLGLRASEIPAFTAELAKAVGVSGVDAPAYAWTEEQKKFFLSGILAGEINCAIGCTEPEAGTDLASLRTRAVLDGDEWVINGNKVFTSGADQADYIWLACRTDTEAPKHKGISIIMVPTSSPGFRRAASRRRASTMRFCASSPVGWPP